MGDVPGVVVTIRGAETPSRDQLEVKVLETTRGILHVEGASVSALPLVTPLVPEMARVAALQLAGLSRAHPRWSWVSRREARILGKLRIC